EDGIRDFHVTGVQTCALPILLQGRPRRPRRGCRSHLRKAPGSLPRGVAGTFVVLLKHRLLPTPVGLGQNATECADDNSGIFATKIGRASCRERVWKQVGAEA